MSDAKVAPVATDSARNPLSSALKTTLDKALEAASSRHHEYATFEHLLLALIDDEDASKVMAACGVDLGELRITVAQYLDTELEALEVDAASAPTPTSGFEPVVERAIRHVRSSGPGAVTGANVLVALFSERESDAVYFLQQQDMSRLDAVSFISHGVSKGGVAPEARGVKGAGEEKPRAGASGRVDRPIARHPEVDRAAQIPFRGPALGWVAIAALVVALLWSAWITRAILDLRDRKPAIVKVQLQGLMAEYVRAQARSNAPQEQIATDTKAFLAQLNGVVTALSKGGQIVLVNEAVVGDGVPDVTSQVRRAVYARVPMPKVAANGVEDRMMAYLKREGAAGERAQ